MAVQHGGDESLENNVYSGKQVKAGYRLASVTVYTIYSRHRGKGHDLSAR